MTFYTEYFLNNPIFKKAITTFKRCFINELMAIKELALSN